MDELCDEPTSKRAAVVADETQSATTSCPVNSLGSLSHVIIGPVADMLRDDQFIVVPDDEFCLALYSGPGCLKPD